MISYPVVGVHVDVGKIYQVIGMQKLPQFFACFHDLVGLFLTQAKLIYKN